LLWISTLRHSHRGLALAIEFPEPSPTFPCHPDRPRTPGTPSPFVFIQFATSDMGGSASSSRRKGPKPIAQSTLSTLDPRILNNLSLVLIVRPGSDGLEPRSHPASLSLGLACQPPHPCPRLFPKGPACQPLSPRVCPSADVILIVDPRSNGQESPLPFRAMFLLKRPSIS
jgi:hypothetical protein